MVMIFYIMSFLTYDAEIRRIPGGTSMQELLYFGIYVVGVFSTLFLFYTNSFIMKRRKREFGLFNILGMGKRHIARVMLWESLYISAITLAVGLFTGILFSKLAEAILFRTMGSVASFTFAIDVTSILRTLVMFCGIFFLILLDSLRQIHLSKPIELLYGSNVGEKQPRANWVMAVIGILLLGSGYMIALRVKDAISAVLLFFVAVILVILGTYCCFISGSVALLKILRKNKKYYYKKNHFISVSGMTYRMKRGGAGLATICILSTIVLVMMSSATCLFMGEDDIIAQQYPRDIEVEVYSIDDTTSSDVWSDVNTVLAENGTAAADLYSFRACSFMCYHRDSDFIFRDDPKYKTSDLFSFASVDIVPLADHNRLTGDNATLSDGEVLLCTDVREFSAETVTFADKYTYKVKEIIDDRIDSGDALVSIVNHFYLVVPDISAVHEFETIQRENFGNTEFTCHTYYGFNLDGVTESDAQIAIEGKIGEGLDYSDKEVPVSIEGSASIREEFYGMYGGLLFLGILLGITFVMAAILIMYYKQITEGYEDQSRFDIMQRVGMTKAEIRKSVGSQILTVFFLPLVTAGIHMGFAFPMVSRLLSLFGLVNTGLFFLVTGVTYVLFALCYTAVYLVTSKAYYRIVSDTQR